MCIVLAGEKKKKKVTERDCLLPQLVFVFFYPVSASIAVSLLASHSFPSASSWDGGRGC